MRARSELTKKGVNESTSLQIYTTQVVLTIREKLKVVLISMSLSLCLVVIKSKTSHMDLQTVLKIFKPIMIF